MSVDPNNACNYKPTQHNTLIGGANNSIVNVVPGTSNFVLTSNGTSADPSYQAAVSSNAFYPISSQTASNSAFILFTSLATPPGDYFIQYDGVLPQTGSTFFQALLSTNNGSTYLTSNYGNQIVSFYSGTDVISGTNASVINLTNNNITSSSYVSGYTTIFQINSGTVLSYGNAQTTSSDSTTGANALHLSTWYQNGSACNSIKFFFSSGNIVSGTFTLYGSGT